MALEKFEYWRSQKHLNIIRSLPCQVCALPPRSQAAHSNNSKFGKGMRIKSSDESCLAMCISCHRGYDQMTDRESSERSFYEYLGHQSMFLKLEGRLLPDAERLLKLRGVL